MKENKYGYIKPVINPTDYVLGAGNVEQVILRPDGQWDSFLGKDELQNHGFETYDCTGFGLENQTVAYLTERFNDTENYSQRTIGINAGTGVGGNDPNVVYQSVRDKGLVPQKLLPFSDDIKTIDEFYSPKPLTPDLVKAGEDWKAKYDFYHEWCFQSSNTHDERVNNMKVALQYSPLGLAVYAWAQGGDGRYMKLGEENHWVCVYGYTENAWKVFDSYDNTHKLYAMENEVNYCKRIHIEKFVTPVPSALRVTWQSILEFLKDILTLDLKLIPQIIKTPMVTEPTPLISPTPPKPDLPSTPLHYLWDTPEQARHSTRVICDEFGLSVDEKNLLCQVIECESGFDIKAVNKNKNGTTDYGIIQANSFYYIGVGKPLASVEEALNNPEKCVRIMMARMKEGGLGDWVCYSSGLYKSYK